MLVSTQGSAVIYAASPEPPDPAWKIGVGHEPFIKRIQKAVLGS